MTADVDPSEVIDLLADEYVRSIVDALQDSARSAPEVARQCGCSEATVYRRLDDLTAAGLVARETEFDPDGHHRTLYRLQPVRLSVSVRRDGLEGDVTRPRDSPADGHHFDRRDRSPRRESAAD
jgi:predicted transcriptional regulator